MLGIQDNENVIESISSMVDSVTADVIGLNEAVISMVRVGPFSEFMVAVHNGCIGDFANMDETMIQVC